MKGDSWQTDSKAQPVQETEEVSQQTCGEEQNADFLWKQKTISGRAGPEEIRMRRFTAQA